MTGKLIPLRPEGVPQDDTSVDCLSFLLSERSESTARAYLQDLTYLGRYLNLSVDQVVHFLCESPPLLVNRKVQEWKRHMVDRGLAPNTVNRRLSCIRALLHTARSLGISSVELATKNVNGGRVKDVRGPSQETVAMMLDQLTRVSSPRGARDACLVALAFSLGLRRQEIHLLDVDDVHLQASSIVITGKGGRRQELDLPPLTRDLLAHWLHFRTSLGSTPPLFVSLATNGGLQRLSTTSIYKVIRAAGEVAGSPVPVRPHGLRRTAINEALSIAGVFAASSFARHRDIRTTMEYVDATDSVRAEISEILDAGLAAERTDPSDNELGDCDTGETLSWL